MENKYYILMADIMGSSRQDARTLMLDFKEVIEHVNQQYQEELLSPLTITLGDEFQGIPYALEGAIQIIVAIEETIVQMHKKIKLRYVLLHGKIDTPINTQIAYQMLGEGLTKARYQLEALKKERRDRFHIQLPEDAHLATLLDLAFVGYQLIVDSWRTKDYDLVKAFLEYEGDYKKVAEVVQKDSSSVFRRKDSLQIRGYFHAKALLFQLAISSIVSTQISKIGSI